MADISSNMFESLLEQVKGYTPTIESVEVGYVEEVGDGIARVSGLENIHFSELVRFSNGAAGIAFNLEKDNVGVIIMGEYDTINEGDEVRPMGRIAS
ncbi:MAG: F0F1 ATP synthase subunit alpha, partial [Chloroflexota bacterium]